jgi:UDP-N-acetylmuramoylalanine--D-glutamate ligase
MNDYNGARILILGAARQGLALARYLAGKGARVIVNDQSPAEKLAPAIQSLQSLPIEWVLGSHPLDLLDRIDLLCVSGGVPLSLPLVTEAMRKRIPVTNDSQIFMEVVPCPVVGITGSAGKTTTTTLVGRMAAAAVSAPRHAWVGGNIGNPLIDHVDQIHPDDLVILELSSFQLELMTRSPQLSAILNVTPNHLDRHGTMEAYAASKARILAFQHETDAAVLGREDVGAWSMAAIVSGSLTSFGLKRPAPGQFGTYLQDGLLRNRSKQGDAALFSEDLILLPGLHNRLNVLAACAIGLAAGFPTAALQAGVAGFKGVAHRIELVRELHGIRWYNNSIATAPERTIAAINSFSQPLVLMLGGRDKNLPWESLAALIHERVDHVVVFGEAAPKIMAAIGALKPGSRPYALVECGGVEQAVHAAASLAQPGSVVLFAPGGTSYDEFKDFEERGERFSTWVNQLS